MHAEQPGPSYCQFPLVADCGTATKVDVKGLMHLCPISVYSADTIQYILFSNLNAIMFIYRVSIKKLDALILDRTPTLESLFSQLES